MIAISILRELVVNIDFRGMDLKKLDHIDRKVDDIEHSLVGMDHEIDESTRDFAKMGVVGGGSLKTIERGADKASNALDRMNKKINNRSGGHGGHERGRGGYGLRDPFLNIPAGVWAGMAPALGQLTGVALAGIGGLAAGFTAATISAVGFGAVAIPIIKKVTDGESEAVKLQEKIKKADTAEERIKAQKELAQLYKDMSKEQRGAVKDLRDFKKYWDELEQRLEKPTFKVFGDSMKAIEGLFTKLEPTIQSTATAVDDLINSFSNNLNAPDMKEFFSWLGSDGANYLKEFGQTAGNFGGGFLNMMEAFGKTIGKDVADSFLNISKNFRDWAADLENNQSFKDFINNARENLPVIKDIFGNFRDIAKELQPIFEKFGKASLGALKELSDFLAHDPLMKMLYNVGSFIGTALDYIPGPGSTGDYSGKTDGDLRNHDPAMERIKKAWNGGKTPEPVKPYKSGSSNSFSPTFHIYASGADANEVGGIVEKKMNTFWTQMNLKHN